MVFSSKNNNLLFLWIYVFLIFLYLEDKFTKRGFSKWPSPYVKQMKKAVLLRIQFSGPSTKF